MSEIADKMKQCLWLSALIRQAGLNARQVRLLLQAWPDLEALMAARPRCMAEAIQGPPDKISRLLSSLKDTSWSCDLAQKAEDNVRAGIKAIYHLDSDYPERLRNIGACPLVLYYRGEAYQEIMGRDYFVTIIGTRTPSAYGRMATERITADLAACKVVIVSGMARGIDGLAHKAALNAAGLTVAVLANGPDLAYPPEHGDLLDRIARSGLVISEHPPGTLPRRQYFPARNRILSGLSDAVAVIEASRKSGTMITAGFAGDQGRDVFAVPGSIFSPYSEGCNQLIREGAELLESAQDLLWRLPIGSVQTKLEQSIQNEWLETSPACGDKQDHGVLVKRLWHLLSGCPLGISEIADGLGLTIEGTASLLTQQELSGRIICERGRYSLTEPACFCI